MNSLRNKWPNATSIEFGDEYMDVYLNDGRMLRMPLDWFPRLERATPEQRKNFEWLGKGEAMHWPDVDEDISVEGLLRGFKAPRTPAYLEGIWSDEITRQTAEVE